MRKVLQLVDSPDGVFQRLGLPLVDPVPDKSVQVERLARALYYYDTGENLTEAKDLAIYKDGARKLIEYMSTLEVE